MAYVIKSYDMPGAKAKEGEGIPRLRAGTTEVPIVSKWGSACDNIWGLFENAANKYAGNQCLGKRVVDPSSGALGEFSFISFAEVLTQAKTVGSALAELGLKPRDTVGIWSANRMEWMISALGAWSQGLTLVPMYDTLGEDAMVYEINHADVSVLLLEQSKLPALAAIAPRAEGLKTVVQFEPLGEESAAGKALTDKGVKLLDFPAFTTAGLSSLASHPVSPPLPEDTAYIMYTSGTTGNPKGVCLSHLGLCISATYGSDLSLDQTDSYLSYLPLAHIFETCVEISVLGHGGKVGYYSGNIKLVMEDVQALKPTLFVGVPRIFQRVYEKVQATLDSKPAFIRALFKCAMSAELKARRSGGHSRLLKVTKSVRAALGGEVRIIISGAAPLPSHIQDFLTSTMGCAVLQGYGMTENSANATIAHADNTESGHVGAPQPTMAVKLVDVPEMGYLSSNTPPTGEVLTFGKCNMSGYHKDPAETGKTLEPDGWLHTGDIGRWNADGTLSIIDRKKNIFKLAQGEYVAVEKVEMALSKSAYISQIWVYGNSFLNTLVAVVVPDVDRLKAWAKEADGFDFKATCAKPEVRALVLSEIKSEAAGAKLKGFEVPKDVLIEGSINELMQGFSVENDCLTPTFKLKRPQLLKKYKAQVDEMYRGLGEDPDKAAV